MAQLAAKLGGETAGAFRSFISAISSIAVVLILAGLLTFYFLKDGDRGWQRVLERPGGWRRERLDEAGRRAVEILGGHMRGTGAVALFDAVTLFIILTVLGIPFALPLSVILFFGGFIPYVGALIASFLAVTVTIQYGGTRDVAILLVYTGVLNIVQGNILAPLILGHAVKLHPAVILCAIPAGGAIAGIPGMFLAVPLLGVLAAIRQPIGDALGEPAGGIVADRPAETTGGRASEDRGPSPQAPPERASGDASIA